MTNKLLFVLIGFLIAGASGAGMLAYAQHDTDDVAGTVLAATDEDVEQEESSPQARTQPVPESPVSASSTVAQSIQTCEEITASARTDDEDGDERDEDEDEEEDADDDRPRVRTEVRCTTVPAPSQTASSSQTPASPAPSPAPSTPATGSTGPKGYTMAEVRAHASASDCWSAINGSVYNLTSFVSNHPGGSGAIKSLCGVDGTAAFNSQHGGARRPESELAALKVGVLAGN